jgi:flagellar hook assembly protein FlgD
VELKIFDIQGRVVKILVNGRIPMGTYRVVWDGTNDQDERVASGTYIAKVFQWGMDGGDFPVKITLLK